MGGVTRTIRKAVKKVAAPIVKVASEVPVVKEVAKAVVPTGRPDTFAGAPKEVIAAAQAQAAETISKATGLGPTPKAATSAAGATTSGETQAQRRRGRRGIQTTSRGVMGAAPVERKSLLGG